MTNSKSKIIGGLAEKAKQDVLGGLGVLDIRRQGVEAAVTKMQEEQLGDDEKRYKSLAYPLTYLVILNKVVVYNIRSNILNIWKYLQWQVRL